MKNRFEQILDELYETPNIEFKRSMSWDGKNSELIKDILALANTPGGGYIIIGVKEDEKDRNLLIAEGICEEHEKTYNYDDVKDQVNCYADPAVNLKIYSHNTNKGKKFIFMEVGEFENFPILCKKSNEQLKLSQGDIYYRTKKGRPSSMRVNNHDDLREIIDRSVINRIKFFQEIGISSLINEGGNKKYENELNVPKDKEIFTNISQNIYLEVTVHPIQYKQNIMQLKYCKELVEMNSIKSRNALPFPISATIPKSKDIIGKNHFEISYPGLYGDYKQIWQMYQSGQFKLYYTVENQQNNQKFISPLRMLIIITKLFRFIGNLTNNKSEIQPYLSHGIILKVELKNIKGTALKYERDYLELNDQLYRLGFCEHYVSKINDAPFENNFSGRDFLESDRLARETLSYFMQRFGYNEIPSWFQTIQDNIDSQGW